MRRLIQTLAALAFLTIPAVAEDADTGNTEARKLVSDLYEAHEGRADGDLTPLWQDPAQREVFFTEGLIARFAAADAAPDSDEAPMLDGDPFYDAQDWDIRDLEVGETATEGDAVTVEVTFTNLGEPRRLVYYLKPVDGKGLKIDDIFYDHDTDSYRLTDLLESP